MTSLTIEEIRYNNLLMLIEENGGQNGGQTEVARRSGTSPTYLSQIVIRFTKASGQVAIVGSKLARKLEQGCDKPVGWMDVAHDGTDEREGQLLDIYRQLSDAARADLFEKATEMVKRRKKKA